MIPASHDLPEMRVLGVVHQFPPDFHSGTEILCLRTMQAMLARGHSVATLAADPKLSYTKPLHHDSVGGIDTIFIPTAKPIGLSAAARLEAYTAGRRTETLAELARAFRPDLIHVHHVSQFGLRAVALLAGIAPVIFTATDFHLICPYNTASLPDGEMCAGPDADDANCIEHHRLRPQHHGLAARGLKNRVFTGVNRVLEPATDARLAAAVSSVRRDRKAAFATASLLIVGSERMHAMFVAAGARQDNLALLPHEAPPIMVPPRDLVAPIKTGYLGTLSAHKGVHILVEALTTIPPEIRFEAIIQGDQTSDMKYAALLRLQAVGDPRIRFVDAVPNESYGAALAALDLVVLPSLWAENRPLTLLSALEHGRYVVGSNVPGIAQTLNDGGGGCLVPPGDPRALALTLIQLLADPAPIQRVRDEPVRRPRFLAYVSALEQHYARFGKEPPK